MPINVKDLKKQGPSIFDFREDGGTKPSARKFIATLKMLGTASGTKIDETEAKTIAELVGAQIAEYCDTDLEETKALIIAELSGPKVADADEGTPSGN